MLFAPAQGKWLWLRGQKLLKVRPHDGSTYLILGQSYLARGDAAKAVAAFKAATEKAPQNSQGYYELSLAYRRQQKGQEAVAAFEQALALDPNLIDALAQEASVCIAKGQADKALERTRRQVRVLPNSPHLYNLLGRIFQERGQDTEEEEAFKKLF